MGQGYGAPRATPAALTSLGWMGPEKQGAVAQQQQQRRLVEADAAPLLAPLSTFPLSVSANGRFLQTAAGNPFRLKIDAAWLMGCHGSVTDQNTYLSGIKTLGYNGFILMNIVHAGGTAWTSINEPNDAANVAPFSTPGDFSTRNSAYFAKVSDLIDRAKAQGLSVVFAHTYAGYSGDNNQGWAVEVASNSTGNCFNWGVYLAQTFTQSNIIWMHGGDRFLSGTQLSHYQQVVSGIQSITRNRLSCAEWDGPSALVTDQTGFTYGINPGTTDIQLNWFYGDGPSSDKRTYPTADAAWAGATTLPVILGEPPYYLTFGTREEIRRAQHWAFCAGSIAGSNAGHKARWDWDPANWTATMTEVSTLDQSYRHALYDSLSWWLMRPSGTGTGYCGRTLIVSTNTADTTWIQACMSSDGNQLLAYVPPTGTGATTFSVDLRSMSGTGTAYWWNPTSGGTMLIGTFANTLSAQSFTTPGNNGTGDNDWMFVLATAWTQPALMIYSTTFSATEAPISESGKWQNNGLDWTLVDTASGIAFGTQTGSGGFDDSFADLIVSGGYGPNVQITTTVSKGTTSGIQEVEHQYRTSNSSHVSKRYEFNAAHDGQYGNFGRWPNSGAKGTSGSDFTDLAPSTGGIQFSIPGGAINNGDVLCSQMVGNVISAWIGRSGAWAYIGSGVDTSSGGGAFLTSGNVGIGFYRESASGAANQFGFTDIKVVAL